MSAKTMSRLDNTSNLKNSMVKTKDGQSEIPRFEKTNEEMPRILCKGFD